MVEYPLSRVNCRSMGKVTGNQQDDCSSQREVRRRFTGPSSSKVVDAYGKYASGFLQDAVKALQVITLYKHRKLIWDTATEE